MANALENDELEDIICMQKIIYSIENAKKGEGPWCRHRNPLQC